MMMPPYRSAVYTSSGALGEPLSAPEGALSTGAESRALPWFRACVRVLRPTPPHRTGIVWGRCRISAKA